MIRCSFIAIISLAFPLIAMAAPPQGKHLTRVFYQDDESKTVKWADLLRGRSLILTQPQVVEGFPKIDPAKQTLVQMELAKGYILVGVRDEEDGKFQSGWVLIDCGLETEPHGNHLDWIYARNPRVRATQLDDQQGNPAHVYTYDDVFYAANDQKNGFTRLAPGEISSTDDEAAIRKKAAFHAGGGGHITLAVSGKKVAFSSWIDREGPNKGRVDLTLITTAGTDKPTTTINLPSGGIHGATACANKVFLAPSDGIDWVEVSDGIPTDPQQIKIQHIDLGKIGEKPRRTGAFTTMGNRVAFVSGDGKDTEFGIIEADKTPPVLTKLAVPLAEEGRPAGMELIKPRSGNPIALMFQDVEGEAPSKCKLKMVELDPNGDSQWTDLRVGPEYPVGLAKIEGHGGHHSISADSDRFRCVFTNPGDGTISVLSLVNRSIEMTFTVGGHPSKVITYGGHVH
jgi:hypothetical protein